MSFRLLFKYCSWRDQYTKENIRQSAVYMSKAAVFNDPFDCLPSYTQDISIDDAKKSFIPYFEKMNLPAEYADQYAQKMAEYVLENPEWLNLMSKVVTPQWQQVIGVSCFTTNPVNPLMWGNYADKHQGICLSYYFPKTGDILSLPPGETCYGPIRAFPMEYSDQRPRPKILQAPGEYHELVRSLWTKEKAWEHEKEWRITTTKYIGLAHYPPEALQGIILGCKMPEEHIQEVKQLMTELPVKPTLFQARLKGDGFEIEVVPLEDSWNDHLK